jgi:hypothetical protein
MRSLLLGILSCIYIATFGQTISYDIPAGYEKDIRPEDYRFLVDTSVAVVADRYQIEFVKEGTIQLVKGQRLQALNLHNLILKCVAVKDTTAWPAIIREHFKAVFRSLDEQQKIDPTNYEGIRKYPSIRIYPHVDLEGTYTLLMLDLPDAFTPVQAPIFDGWKKAWSPFARSAAINRWTL